MVEVYILLQTLPTSLFLFFHSRLDMGDQGLDVKAVLLMPTLHVNDLFSESKVTTFVKKMKSYVVSNPGTKMYEGVAGDVWEMLIDHSSEIALTQSVATEEGEGVSGYFPEDETLTQVLRDLFNLGQGEGARATFKKLKMKACKDGNITLEDVIKYQVEWRTLLRVTDPSHWPQRVDLIKIFFDGISHNEISQKLKVQFDADKEARKTKKTAPELTVENYIKSFVEIGRDLAEVLSRANNIRAANSSSRASDDLSTLVNVKKAYSIRVGSDDTDGGSLGRNAKRKLKLSLNTSGEGKSQKGFTCWGCNLKGHSRDKCPHKAHKDFVKFPGKATKSIKL